MPIVNTSDAFATKEQLQEYLNKMTGWQRNQLHRAVEGNYKDVVILMLEHFVNLKHHKEIPYG